MGSPTNWRAAACVSAPPDVFFPTDQRQIDTARGLCSACPVQADCLREALKLRDITGFRAGLTGDERKALLPKGRPKAAIHAITPEIVRLHTVLKWTAPAIAVALGLDGGVVWRVLKEHRDRQAREAAA